MLELDLAAKVDTGLIRDTNQDVARSVQGLRLILVADGMGGHDHGDIASQLAADALCISLERQGGPGDDPEQARDRLAEAFREANVQLSRHPQAGGRAGMGTTLVAALIAGQHVVVAHVGDSRCYRLRGQELEPLTHDHSYIEDMRREGLASTPEEKAVAEQWGHVLTRCINGSSLATADVRVETAEPGDIYLVCSDGLWGGVNAQEISRQLAESNSAIQACERLISAAWQAGGGDNIGVAVARLLKPSAR